MDYANYGGDDGDDGWEKEPWKKFQKDNEKKVYNKEKKPASDDDDEDDHGGDVLLGTYHGFKVYIETHQGKHCLGQWPGFRAVGKMGPYFKVSLARYGNTPLFHLLCNSNAFRDAVTAQNADGENGLLFFDFKNTVCGTSEQKWCQLQWKRSGNNIYIHGCPDPKGKGGNQVDIRSLK